MLLKSTWNLSFCFLFGVQKCPEVMSCSVLVYWHKLICFHNMRWSQFHYKLNQVLGYLFVFNPTVFKLVILLCSSFLFCCIIFVNCLFDNQETVANNLQKTVCNDVILNDWNKITNIKINEGGGQYPHLPCNNKQQGGTAVKVPVPLKVTGLNPGFQPPVNEMWCEARGYHVVIYLCWGE